MPISIKLEHRVAVKELERDIVVHEHNYLYDMLQLTKTQQRLQKRVDELFEEYKLTPDKFSFDLGRLEFVEKPCVDADSPGNK